MILFYAHWETKGGLYQNLSINATGIPQLAYACDRTLKLYLVSKLRHDSMLYFPFTGEYAGKGKPQKYGDKLTLETLPEKSLCETTVKKTSKPSFTRFKFGTRIFLIYLISSSLLKRTLKREKLPKYYSSVMI